MSFAAWHGDSPQKTWIKAANTIILKSATRSFNSSPFIPLNYIIHSDFIGILGQNREGVQKAGAEGDRSVSDHPLIDRSTIRRYFSSHQKINVSIKGECNENRLFAGKPKRKGK